MDFGNILGECNLIVVNLNNNYIFIFFIYFIFITSFGFFSNI